MRVKSKRGEGEMTIHELIFGSKTIETVREAEKRRKELIRTGKLRTVITGPCCDMQHTQALYYMVNPGERHGNC